MMADHSEQTGSVAAPAHERRHPSTEHWGRSWLWIALLAVACVAVAFQWRQVRSDTTSAGGLPDQHALPRTRSLIEQKTLGMGDGPPAKTSGGGPVVFEDLPGLLEDHLGRPVTPEALAAVEQVMAETVVPGLWSQSQKVTADNRFVSQHAMAGAIQRYFPFDIPSEAQAVVFPDTPRLRHAVPMAAVAHVRQSGRPWRWIGRFLDDADPRQQRALKELDVYAAEQLADALAVMAVGVVHLADRSSQRAEAPLDAEAIQGVLRQIRRQLASPASASPPAAFSQEVRRRLVAALPDPMFRDISERIGLDYVHRSSRAFWEARAALTVPVGVAGGGVAAGDFDGDGWDDLYFAGDGAGRLYRNVEGRRLQDATASSGGLTGLSGETRAGYFIDYDNDGDADLYLTFVAQPNRLLENDGGGRFTDVTEPVGLGGGDDISHEAVWADVNNDGLLDVYVASFGQWTEGLSPKLGHYNTDGRPNRLYLQRLDTDGRRRFEEVAERMGVDDAGWTHCVGALDFDGDGWADLFSLNDFGHSRVYRNIEGRRFVEVSLLVGLDDLYNAMNFSLVDLDHSGDPAIYITQIMELVRPNRDRAADPRTMVAARSGQSRLGRLNKNKLYAFRRDTGRYADVHDRRLETVDFGWAWGGSFLDYENDGDPDLLVLNGTEGDMPMLRGENRQEHLGGRAFMSLFAGERNAWLMSEGGYFYDVSDRATLSFAGNSRSAAVFDFDRDGDLDIAIANYEGRAHLFENAQRSGHRWVRFRLEGTRSNRDAIGARVEVRFGDEARYGWVVSGTGFLGQDPKTLHFGLGGADRVDRAIITWPSGTKQELADLPADTTHRIREPTSEKGSEQRSDISGRRPTSDF